MSLADGFDDAFEGQLAQFLIQQKYLNQASDLDSKRFLARSVAPHVQTLSSLFNRQLKPDQSAGIDESLYWNDSSNAMNRRLAYFLAFGLPNSVRVAGVWSELSRLGYVLPASSAFSVLELGAGTGAGVTGCILGSKFSDLKIPTPAHAALIEQNRGAMELGSAWIEHLEPSMSTRCFHRKLTFDEDWLPRSAPKFTVIVASFFLNEFDNKPSEWADQILNLTQNHLVEDGVIILVEPALKLQSRRLLECRKHLLKRVEEEKRQELVLLPCLGHQICGALEDPDDWCHEEVTWWRPKYLRALDEIAGLDRRTLPFSYLVISRSNKTRTELLPGLAGASTLHRLVSPAHKLGRDLEFFTCGQDGKRRVRVQPDMVADDIQRGDLLGNAVLRGDPECTRLESLSEQSAKDGF